MQIINGEILNIGDYVSIKFTDPFVSVKKFNDYSDVVIGETTSRFFVKEFRYSYDNQEYSSWRELTNLNLQTFTLQKKVFIEVKYTRDGTDTTGSLNVKEFDIITDYITPPKYQNQNCLSECVKCDAILNDCEDTFDPYKLVQINCLKSAIESAVSKRYAHQSRYWRVNPDIDTKDVIFKEYSLGKYESEKCIPIIIPDNALPDNDISFTAGDMDFYDLPFEVHILVSDWSKQFGALKYPAEGDALYIDILDRMYQVDSSYLFKPMGAGTGTYYRVNLAKWQDTVNNQFPTTEREKIDELTTSFEEIFGGEHEDELRKYSKEEQYTVQTYQKDAIRMTIDKLVEITDYKLVNNWTVISNSYYNLSKVNNTPAVVYSAKPLLEENMTFMSWINIPSALTSENTIINGFTTNKGIKISVTSNTLKVYLNSNVYTLPFTYTLNKWYGIVVTVANDFNELIFDVYELPTSLSTNTEFDDDNLDLVSTSSVQITPELFNVDINYMLQQSNVLMTNIRLFDKIVEPESRSLVLNQSTVGENQHALLIDNANKPLDLIYHRVLN